MAKLDQVHDHRSQTAFTRRRFLKGAGTLAAGVGLGGFGSPTLMSAPHHLPKPKNSGVEHVVVLMMENRSFDSFFGLASRCAWTDTGVSSVDRQGVAHPTQALAPQYQGCGHRDPDHSYASQFLLPWAIGRRMAGSVASPSYKPGSTTTGPCTRGFRGS